MFKDAQIPKKLVNSPINEAIFEIRYNGIYPGEALYGVLFDVFQHISKQKVEILPILQIPQQIRDMDPNLFYQHFYRTQNNNLGFSVGPHSIVFSALKPYPGWQIRPPQPPMILNCWCRGCPEQERRYLKLMPV
jgi:uncharacterized protein (TIGR04255 family)